MNQRETVFNIKAKNIPNVIAAIKSLRGKETIDDKHFSWVDPKFSTRDNIADIMYDFRWEVEQDDNSNIVKIRFTGEKLGDDLVLFEQIAPFVEDGSFIEMSGECDDIWRWVFKGGKVKEISPNIIWPEV